MTISSNHNYNTWSVITLLLSLFYHYSYYYYYTWFNSSEHFNILTFKTVLLSHSFSQFISHC